MKVRGPLGWAGAVAALCAGGVMAIPASSHAADSPEVLETVCVLLQGTFSKNSEGSVCTFPNGDMIICELWGCYWISHPRTAGDPSGPASPPQEGVFLDDTPLTGGPTDGNHLVVAFDVMTDMTFAQIDQAASFINGAALGGVDRVLTVEGRAPSLTGGQVDTLLSSHEADGLRLTGTVNDVSMETAVGEVSANSDLPSSRLFVVRGKADVIVILLRW